MLTFLNLYRMLITKCSSWIVTAWWPSLSFAQLCHSYQGSRWFTKVFYKIRIWTISNQVTPKFYRNKLNTTFTTLKWHYEELAESKISWKELKKTAKYQEWRWPNLTVTFLIGHLTWVPWRIAYSVFHFSRGMVWFNLNPFSFEVERAALEGRTRKHHFVSYAFYFEHIISCF